MENGHRTLTMDTIKNWILFVLLIAGLGAGWAAVGGRIDSLEEKMSILEVRAAKSDETQLQIQLQLAAIQRDIIYIRNTLDSHSNTP